MKFMCNVEDLNKALQSVKKIMDITKQQPYVLMQATGSVLAVCYCDGSHAYMEKATASIEVEGNVVVEFENLLRVVNSALPTATLSVNPLEVEVVEGIININVEKCISDGDLGGKVASSMQHQLQAENVSKNPNKYGVLTRLDYFGLVEDNGVAEWDIWDKQEFKETIQLAMPGDKEDRESTIYFSSKDKEVKVRGNLYVGIVKAPTIEKSPFALRVNEAVAFSDVISKFPGSDVYIHTSEDRKFTRIKNSEDSAVLWFEVAPSKRIDGKIFDMYSVAEIADIQMRVHKGALEGVISSIIATTKDKEHNLKIIHTEDGYALSLAVSVGGGSMKMDMKTTIESLRCRENILPENYSASLDIKTLKDIIDKCKYEWLSISLAQEDKVMRVVDVEIVNEDGQLTPVEVSRFYMTLA